MTLGKVGVLQSCWATNQLANANAATATSSTVEWKAALPDHVRVDAGDEGGEEAEQTFDDPAVNQYENGPDKKVQRQAGDRPKGLRVDAPQTVDQNAHAHEGDEPGKDGAVWILPAHAMNQPDNEKNQYCKNGVML